jgi:hypothetical protein
MNFLWVNQVPGINFVLKINFSIHLFGLLIPWDGDHN